MFILNRAEVLPRSALVLAWGVQLSILAGTRLLRRAIYEGDLNNMLGAVGVGPKSAEGETLREMQNRLTWGMRRSGPAMRIVHEHTSAPLGFEDMKAILQRNPST